MNAVRTHSADLWGDEFLTTHRLRAGSPQGKSFLQADVKALRQSVKQISAKRKTRELDLPSDIRLQIAFSAWQQSTRGRAKAARRLVAKL